MNVAVGDNLLKLVYRHSIRTCIPGLLAFLYMAYYLSLGSVENDWIYWIVIASLIQLLRPLALKTIINSLTLSMNARLILVGINTVIYGASIGAGILIFTQLDLSQQLMISVILVGFGGTAGTLNAGYTPFYLCFVCPILVPLAIFWVMDPGNYLSTFTSLLLGGLTVMMVHLTTVMGRHNFMIFSNFIELSEKQALMSDELSDALERAEREQEDAVASNLSKTRFLAAASHDLRQPVHIISLFGASLKNMVKEDSAKTVISDMNQTIGSLSSQLNELLDIAKLDSDSLKPEIKALKLYNVIRLVTDELKSEAIASGIDLVNSVDKEIYVQSNDTMLTRIVRNIVGNAIKYTRNGSVTLSTEIDGNTVILSIVDTGIGMQEHEQMHIFEEFYQIDNPERAREKGVGLGLSIVERLTKALSHELSITSTPGEGTCVDLRMKTRIYSSATAINSSRTKTDAAKTVVSVD